jgi:hypothetical protein
MSERRGNLFCCNHHLYTAPKAISSRLSPVVMKQAKFNAGLVPAVLAVQKAAA